MCGFAGYLSTKSIDNEIEALNELTSMNNAISHRGPDDFGYAILDNEAALGHRRLSILDLSTAGHQPMSSKCGRYTIVFNGEVYNHIEIRFFLEKQRGAIEWRGHSDTESLLEGFSLLGIEETLKRASGMFAFAVWDCKLKTLTLGRDRIGEKPLYYGWQGKGENKYFLFGSDLKSLKIHSSFENMINNEAVNEYVKYNYIPAPRSIYDGIFKLLPGHILNVNHRSTELEPRPFWTLGEVIDKRSNSFSGTDLDFINQLDALLVNSIKRQMISDVPIGAFLSGGVDSSTIVAIMQSLSIKPIKTFSIGFNENDYNEAVYAKTVAKHLGTDHTELYVSANEALNVIPQLPNIYSEPFSDSSQIPTYLVSKLAKSKVTVSLSGDAGDELFGGYNRYIQFHNRWNSLMRLPQKSRRILSSFIKSIPPNHWDKIFYRFNNLIPKTLQFSGFGYKLHKAAEVLICDNVNDFYSNLATHWKENIVLHQYTNSDNLFSKFAHKNISSTELMMAIDTITYLPDDILVKVDRAAMAVSLETRVPFLDPEIIEFAWSLPEKYKFRNGKGKWILREVLNRYVPYKLIDRPKMGFGVPIDKWLRGPLRDWACDLLNEKKIREDGFFDPQIIKEKLSLHLSGKENWQYHLWDILMFQAWLNER